MSIVDVTQEELDALVPMMVCDRCGEEIPLDEANFTEADAADWAGAALCNDCWAEVEEEAQL